MRMLAFAALCLAVACPSAPHSDPGSCVFGGAGGDGPGETVLLVGEPTVVTLQLVSAATCASPVAASSVDTSVVGPDNLPVMSSQTNLVSPSTSFSPYSVDVTFKPAVPGNYHLVGRFAPNLGVAQADLRAAINHTSDATQTVYSAQTVSTCARFSVTDRGTLLCSTTDTKIAAFRAGAQVDAVPGDLVATRGDDVWVATGTNLTLKLFTDTGSGPLVAVTADFHTASPINQLVPGEADVVVLMQDGVSLVSMRDAGFVESRPWPPLAGATAGARSGNDLIVAAAATFYVSLDGGAFVAGPDQTNLTCLGYGPEGLWLSGNDQLLKLYTADGTGPAATLAPLGLGAWSRAPNPSKYGPLQYGQLPYTSDLQTGTGQPCVATWDAAQHELFLGTWGASAGDPIASARWAVLWQPNGDVVVKPVSGP